MATTQATQHTSAGRESNFPSQVAFDLRHRHLWSHQFPALHLVRTNWLVKSIARLTFLTLAVAVIALIFVPWQQTSRGYGRVLAFDPQQRPQKVGATADGIVTRVREGLREGAHVKRGEVILELEPFSKDLQQQLQAQLTQLEQKLETAKVKRQLAEQNIESQRVEGTETILAAKEYVEKARAKVDQCEDEVRKLEAVMTRTQQNFKRVKSMALEGLFSTADEERATEDYKKAVADFEKAENAVIEASKEESAKQKELTAKENQMAIKNREVNAKLQEAIGDINTVEKEIAETKAKQSEYGDRLEITSPHDGYLHELLSLAGSAAVKKGDLLFEIVPDTSELAVEMTVRGNDVPLLRLDDEVRLQFEGWPAVQTVGWPSAAVGTFGGRIAVISPTDDGKGNFRIVVRPDHDQIVWPDSRYLRQGVLANGWVMLSRNDGTPARAPLGYEIWRQLNGFPPVVGESAPDQEKGTDKEDKKKVKLPK